MISRLNPQRHITLASHLTEINFNYPLGQQHSGRDPNVQNVGPAHHVPTDDPGDPLLQQCYPSPPSTQKDTFYCHTLLSVNKTNERKTKKHVYPSNLLRSGGMTCRHELFK